MSVNPGALFGAAIALLYCAMALNAGGLAELIARRAVFAFDRNNRIGRRRATLIVRLIAIIGIGIGIALAIGFANS